MNSMSCSFSVHVQFVADAFTPRTIETHKRHCASLHGPLHEHVATTYGLTRDSILNSLRYFHVTSGLPPDVMHDMLEGKSSLRIIIVRSGITPFYLGVLQLEMRCLLTVLIKEQKLFSLEIVNTRIRQFPYGNDVTDRPKPLPPTYTSGSCPKKTGGK